MPIMLFGLHLIVFLSGCLTVKPFDGNSQPVSHEIWHELVQKHVTVDGKVNYKGFIKDSVRLNEYLDLLSSAHPNKKHWTADEQLAYWINVYNAFTVKLITDHYPVESIKDIKRGIIFVNTVWDISFIEIEGESYSLNNVEHGIIRKQFSEPRIHFAVNCASFSCPKLQNVAFTAENLDSLLTASTVDFLYDETKNIIKPGNYQVSKLFQWYRGDFTKNGTVIQYINQYLKPEDRISESASLSYMDYDWSLNE